MSTTNPTRTVAATVLTEYPDNPAPGACYVPTGDGWGDDSFCFACPGCSQFGLIRVGAVKPERTPSWVITRGEKGDPTGLSLSPSIHCQSCCGWHGYLTGGVFRSC